MEIIQNIRGGQKLCYDGYMHTNKVSRNSYVLWEYSERRGLKCNGTLTTDISIENIISKKEHSHSSDENKVQAAKVKSVMKDHATATRGKPSQIVADNVVNVPVEVRAALGNIESVKRVIRRRKRGALPKDPPSLCELELDEKLTHFEGEEFLIHDSGKDVNNRMMVFATSAGLHHLARSSQWFMDGTFASVPKLFSQLYNIRAPLGETSVACVYAFLNGKSQNVYEELFTAVNEKCEKLGFNCDLEHINMDFELAVIKEV